MTVPEQPFFCMAMVTVGTYPTFPAKSCRCVTPEQSTARTSPPDAPAATRRARGDCGTAGKRPQEAVGTVCAAPVSSPGGDSPRDRHGHRASPWSRQGERHPACWGTQFWCVLSTVVLCSEAAGAGRAALPYGACRSPWFATAGAYQMGRDSQLVRRAEQAGPDPATALTHNLTGSVHFKLQNLSFSYVSFMNARQCFATFHLSDFSVLSAFPSEQINPLTLLPFLACQRVTRSSASEGPCEEQGGQSCELPCPAKSPLKDRMAVQSIIKSLKMKMKQAHIFC